MTKFVISDTLINPLNDFNIKHLFIDLLEEITNTNILIYENLVNFYKKFLREFNLNSTFFILYKNSKIEYINVIPINTLYNYIKVDINYISECLEEFSPIIFNNNTFNIDINFYTYHDNILSNLYELYSGLLNYGVDNLFSLILINLISKKVCNIYITIE